MRKWFIIPFTILFVFILTLSVFASTPQRLAGNDRFETAAVIAQDGWQTSDYAILANGQNYPDALSAVPLSKKYDAPILLTNPNSLPSVTKQRIINLQVKNLFIIGGTSVISPVIESEVLSMGIKVIRLSGKDRFETAIQVANQFESPSEVFVAIGYDYSDALSIGPIAALTKAPIILVPKDYIPDTVKKYISDNKITKTYVMGDNDIISDNVTSQFPGSERILGVDKYIRNINANIKFDNFFISKDVCVATGENFADALTGAAYAAKKGIPVVLVNNSPAAYTRLYTVAKLNLADTVNGNAYIFGGQGVVPDSIITTLYTLPGKLSSPGNLVAIPISSSEINIQWDQVSGADYYYIYYSNDGKTFVPASNSSGEKIQYKWFPGYSFTLTGNPSNFTVYFKVTAIKDGIESDYSNIASATTFNNIPQIKGPLKLIADDSKHMYLGKLTTNVYDSESIFNEFGTYGNKFSSKSIYNEFGTYGSEFSLYSPFNEFSTSPPLIVDGDGNIIGRLTLNKFVSGAISPYVIYDVIKELGF